MRRWRNRPRNHPKRWNLQYGDRPNKDRPKPMDTKNPRPASKRPRGWFF
jgi:hypothetical protein